MHTLREFSRKPLSDCTDHELFNILMKYTDTASAERGYNEGKKKLYYISAEFLIGKLLSNNLINLGIYDQMRDELATSGKDISRLEDIEREPSLGNGGLGRLAACFLDSLATLGLPADGIGLAYHYGLFRQVFAENKQAEIPDSWLCWGNESPLHPTAKHFIVNFGGLSLTSTMYEITITGYHSKCGRLRLFDIDSIDERIIGQGIEFDKTQITKALTLFLYPDDSDEKGRLLRVYQEYFLSSNAAQLILQESIQRGSNLHDLSEYAAVQINDTHPTMVILELIRLLEQKGIGEDEAITIVGDVCAYTNHTILAEALERWPLSFIEKVAPQLIPIIKRLDEHVAATCTDPFVRIIDDDNNVHMANIDIHIAHSVNGVAKLHTEILKTSELKPFFNLYPNKFNNKTNGITFRRWLIECNPQLSFLIDSKIGQGWKTDATELEGLCDFAQDSSFLEELMQAKTQNKARLAKWLSTHQQIQIDPESIFDVQAKRLHEYKRQQLSLLWAIHVYQDIQAGVYPMRPITLIYAAKAAPAYVAAKDIIHAILTLSHVIESNTAAHEWLRVIMIENYNVSAAEKLIPACDISEQISLASKEASGTSNMKFMLNGAVTIGTMDGANVEIANLVGPENIFTFGMSSDEVIAHYKMADYNPKLWYQRDSRLASAIEFLTGPEMVSAGDETCLRRLHDNLMHKDYFMTLPDFESYCSTKDDILTARENETDWARRSLINIAKAGFFSSDRTIAQYNKDIWHL